MRSNTPSSAFPSRFTGHTIWAHIDTQGAGDYQQYQLIRGEVGSGASFPSPGIKTSHLSEQHQLQEAPRRHEPVQITQRLPKLERPQHLAIDSDVAPQIRVGDLP